MGFPLITTGVHGCHASARPLVHTTKGLNVRKIRQILRRLARPHRPAQTQILHHRARRAQIRGRAKTTCPPSLAAGGKTLREILRSEAHQPLVTNKVAAARLLLAYAGSVTPHQLSAAHIFEVDEAIRASGWTHATKYTRSAAVRQILRWLWEEHGTPKLDQHVRHYPPPSPRNVTAERSDFAKILAHAEPHMRLWLLLCSDLAMRSGTAIAIAPQHYHRETGTLRFVTKYQEAATLPVTNEIRALIETCDLNDPEPFVRQLWLCNCSSKARPRRDASQRSMVGHLRRQFKDLLAAAGITRRIVPHDLRRTTAVGVLRATNDIRQVQAVLTHKRLTSTIWYLDHDLFPVPRTLLELVKAPPPKEQTA